MLISLFATSDLARRVAERSLRMGSFTLFHPQKPIDLRAQSFREGLKLVVKNMAVIIFDFGNCRSVELNAEPGESP
jgi:hypothetical protein